MDEVEVGAYNINKTKTKFSFGGSNFGSKRGQEPPEKPAKISKLETKASAEEKFDAIFGAPAPVSSRKFSAAKSKDVPKKTRTPKIDPLVTATRHAKNKIIAKPKNPITPKNDSKLKLSSRSPFALAFGSTNGSDDSDDDLDTFGNSGSTNDKNDSGQTAEQTWDEIMAFGSNDKPKKRTLKLGSFAKGNTPKSKQSDDRQSEKTITPPPIPINNENPADEDDDPYDDFDEGSNSQFSLSVKEKSQQEIKNSQIENKKPEKLSSTEKPKVQREKRFFKSRKPEQINKIITTPIFSHEQTQNDKDVFKKPTLPTPAPQGSFENNDVLVPEHTRISENQVNDKELADDLKYYLDGIKDETDINLRALSALGFAQRCNDDEFIKFLGDKKLSKTNKAHNLGQHLLLLLEDASKGSKSSHSFALAAACAFYKACTDRRIGISKWIMAIVKKLLEVNLVPLPDSPENDRREFHKMQPKVSELMLPLKPRQGTKNWDFRSVASEVVIKWSLDYQKSLFNALLLIGGLLEHITSRLIDTISINKIEDLEVDHFERVFDAFAVQTQAQFGKAQEAIVTKTRICDSLRRFLDLLDPKDHFKQGSFADRIMMHITSMCTYHPKSKEDESTKTLTVVTNKLCQADFVPYCLKMLKEYADQMSSRDEKKHTRKIGIAILLNLVAFSPLARTKVNQEQNMTLICDVLKEEKKDLFDLHDGNVSDLDTTRVVDTLDDNEKKIMTEDEQRTYGNIVSKSARHIGHVMTIGYAALILAHLIKANEFVVKKIKAQLDSECFKLSLDCFDEMENILSATGKEDDKSKRLIQEARDIFSKHGYH